MDYRKPFRVLRAARHLTQKELAQRIGVSHAVINHCETGARNPSRDVMERAAKALGVSLHLFTTLAATPQEFEALAPSIVSTVVTELMEVVVSGKSGLPELPPPVVE